MLDMDVRTELHALRTRPGNTIISAHVWGCGRVFIVMVSVGLRASMYCNGNYIQLLHKRFTELLVLYMYYKYSLS